MKKGIRFLGIDDAAFEFEDERVFLTGVVYRGTQFIEDINISSVEVDGWNSTEKVIEIFNQCSNHRQLKTVILDGISFGGFNIVDIEKVSEETGKPVIAVTSNKPDRDSFKSTMEKTGNQDEVFEKLDEPETVDLEDGKVYIQFAGTDRTEAAEFVTESVIHGLTPEPIRVADMIGRALKDQIP